MIRRAIIAIALLAGLAPTFGQAPAPVPGLPDSERRTSYSISSSKCLCGINFAIFGDSTDVDAWIEVWINGTRYLSTDPTFGWVLTSPTGSLSKIARPITDGVLTFNAIQTGTVQIVGARRPRRVSQFTENRGVAARDLNQALTDVIAMNRETWDKINDVTGRGLFGLPGENIGPMPSASARAGGFLVFDAFGNPKITQPTTGTGNVIGTGPTVVGNLVIWNNTTGTSINDTGVAFGSQPQNRVLATPSGSSGVPSFRALVSSDLPIVPLNKGGTGADTSAATANQIGVYPGGGGAQVLTAITSLINTVCGLSPTTCVSVFGYSNVMWFGATGNGSTDDTTALQACHTTGKVCFYPAGNYKFSTLTMSSGGMLGAGPGQSFLASTDASSGNVITYTGTGGLGANVPLFRDIYIQDTNSKAAGALIKFAPSSATLSNTVIDNVVGVGPPIIFDLLNCDSYKITNSSIQNYSVAGVQNTNAANIDDGDGQISGNFINTGTGTGSGVLWHSGGGVRLYGNKILGGAVGVDIQPTYASGATSDFIIANNSIEAVPTAGIRMGRASGAGTVANIQIIGNEIAVNAPVLVDTSGAFGGITVTGNIFGTQGANGAVALQFGTSSFFVVVGNFYCLATAAL